MSVGVLLENRPATQNQWSQSPKFSLSGAYALYMKYF